MPTDIVAFVDSLPGWGSFALSAATLIRSKRLERAKSFADRLEEHTGLTADQVRERLERLDTLAERVADLWDLASRTVDDDKHLLLARAAAAGIRGDEDVPLDDLGMFARTLREVDAPHVKLLKLVAHASPQSVMVGPGLTRTAIGKLWPAAVTSLEPLVATIQREGLVRDTSMMGSPYAAPEPTWMLSPYGARFLDFVRRRLPSFGADDDTRDGEAERDDPSALPVRTSGVAPK